MTSQANNKNRFSTLQVPDASIGALSKLWDSIETFVVDDLGDGFQARDIYSLIVVIMNGLEVIFPATAGSSLKEYAVFLTNELINDMTKKGILTEDVSDILLQIPVGTIIDLISAVGKGMALGRFGSSTAVTVDPAFVRAHWALRK
jgi:hypothetical protein